ncbi:hypothetical protein ACFL4B_01530 [Candidatus Neomarinimicrobiota bacterium]
MLETFLKGGPFIIIILMLFGIIIIISIKNIKGPYHTNSIVLLGILTAVIGILATYMGINMIFTAISDMGDISPLILINGLKTALITSYTGSIILLISTGLWYFFIKRHKLLGF